eukprot:Amastigsp_a508501_771.p3 type:complete len:250 gc:universal Amastigsp_a508501_771:951-202(-)
MPRLQTGCDSGLHCLYHGAPGANDPNHQAGHYKVHRGDSGRRDSVPRKHFGDKTDDRLRQNDRQELSHQFPQASRDAALLVDRGLRGQSSQSRAGRGLGREPQQSHGLVRALCRADRSDCRRVADPIPRDLPSPPARDDAQVPQVAAHGGRRVHLPPVLLPRDPCAAASRACERPPDGGAASSPCSRCQGASESVERCPVRLEGGVPERHERVYRGLSGRAVRLLRRNGHSAGRLCPRTSDPCAGRPAA